MAVTQDNGSKIKGEEYALKQLRICARFKNVASVPLARIETDGERLANENVHGRTRCAKENRVARVAASYVPVPTFVFLALSTELTIVPVINIGPSCPRSLVIDWPKI
jgi:hypothetical protein